MAQCKARTRSGQRCKATAGADGLCFTHSPRWERKRAVARRKGGRGRAYPRLAAGSDDLTTPEGIRAGLQQVLAATWLLDNGTRRTRALCAVYALALRLLESEVQERLDALESRLEAIEHGTPR